MENNTFWYVMVGNDRVNVMRMDPTDVSYYFWSDAERKWVHDNGLIEFVHGPDRSLSDARPVEGGFVEAAAWLNENTNFNGTTESVESTLATVPTEF